MAQALTARVYGSTRCHAEVALLSASTAGAFFDQENHTLYIDLNHDKQFSAADDMAIKLQGVDSLSDSSLLF